MDTLKKIYQSRKECISLRATPVCKSRIKTIDGMFFHDSKFAGVPYLPVGIEPPRTKKGEPMRLLAQINFRQMYALKNFPADGILQFYIDPFDDCYGYNFDAYENDGGYHVQYIPYNKEIGYLETQVIDIQEQQDFPIEVPHKLEMYPMSIPMPTDNPLFEIYFAQEIEKSMGSEVDFEEMYSEVVGESPEHRIGGYPSFVQQAPYFISESPDEYTLLLQIGYQEYICFGDAGFMSFFIKTEDLKKSDFSNVLLEYACG